MGNTWFKVFFIICDYNIIFYRIYSDNFRGKSTACFQILSSPLNMLLISVQNSYIELIYGKECEKKFKSKIHGQGRFPSFQNLDVLFRKFTVEQVLKSFSGRNNSLEFHVFWFSNSLPHGLVEPRKLRALISWVLG